MWTSWRKAGSTALRPARDCGKRRGRIPRRRDGVILDGEAWEIDTAEGDSRFEEGARVFHKKFGYGRVESRDGNKLEVAFDKAGTKKVIDSFVEPA